jgi:tetratricopeptide (TPR) repeat protein
LIKLISSIQNALKKREAVLPIKHPDLATTYNNLGLLHYIKGDLDQADEFFIKCLEIREAVLPSNHPDRAEIYKSQGLLCEAKGDLDQAEIFFMNCLDIYIKQSFQAITQV